MTETGAETAAPEHPLDLFLVAGEKSGDELGARLIAALREQAAGALRIQGVGGEAMAEQGLVSLFSISDIAVMGFLPVIARLPTLLRRIRETADAIIASPPDALVIIDSPDFTHRVARRVRRRLPDLPIIDYVSPSVWAWRPGRAKKMRGYVDLVLALLPFEPDAHRRLGGPPCVYVGHPLIERISEFRPDAAEAQAREGDRPTIVVLPGSRHGEIEKLMEVFGETIDEVQRACGECDFVIPAVSHLENEIRERAASWRIKPRIVLGEAEKLATFRRARAALAASGTVTLELALAHVPMVVGYRVSKIEAAIVRRLATVQSIVLPNLALGENVIPEFIQAECTPARLAARLSGLVLGGAEREAQMSAFKTLDGRMLPTDGQAPSALAARGVLSLTGRHHRRPTK